MDTNKQSTNTSTALELPAAVREAAAANAPRSAIDDAHPAGPSPENQSPNEAVTSSSIDDDRAAESQQPNPDAPKPSEPSLASRSAPLAAAACLSSPNTSRVLHPPEPVPTTSLHGVSSHTLLGRGGSAFLVNRSPLLAATTELSRRLRGLLTTAVNFRDVELMPQALEALEGQMGLMGGQPEEAADADAATGQAAAAAPSPKMISSSLISAHGSSHDLRGLSGGGASTGATGGSDGGAGASGSGAGGGGGGAGGEGDAGGGGSCWGGGGAAGLGQAGGPASGTRQRLGGAVVRKNKLVIIMVGLPGRGKTFLCNKLCCYLNWLGHATRHFNVGQYRRHQKPADEMQDAAFFDQGNKAGLEARHRALNAALDDLMAWLRSDVGQVAVFDATNTTESRRNFLRSRFHGVWQYLFIETICSDPAVLEQNYRNKMQYSPDYQGVDTDRAVADFLARIAKYEEVYEPIADRNLHYIKLIDMVTGRGYMDINRISGYLPGKIVFFLMQVCKAGLTSARRIWLTRHGESEYNQKGLIGGDSSLSERGERYSQELPGALISRLPQGQTVSVAVWTSTLKRTIQTARFLPFPKLRWKALDEINAGICDGMTYEQIAQQYPHEYEARKKDKLRYRYPAGESYMDVIQRVEPVIIELERERECVVVVAHQAVLRAVYAYFMNVPPEDIPRLSIPLHTLIELTPMPDGTMAESRFPVDLAGPGPAVVPEGVSAAALTAPLVRSPSGTSGVEMAAAVAAKAAAGLSGMSPLSSVNSGISSGSGRQEPGGLLAPGSPAPEAPEGDPGSPPSVEGSVRGEGGAAGEQAMAAGL